MRTIGGGLIAFILLFAAVLLGMGSLWVFWGMAFLYKSILMKSTVIASSSVL